MSNNAVGIAVLVPSIVMVGLLLIVVAGKVLDIARERARSQMGAEHPAVAEVRQVVAADLAEIRGRLDALERHTQGEPLPPDEARG